MKKEKAPRNRTLVVQDYEKESLGKLFFDNSHNEHIVPDALVNGDTFSVLSKIENKSIDLLVVDPPYNLNKDFGGNKFRKTDIDSYSEWLDSWIKLTIPLLKPTASIYICSDWHTSTSVHVVASKYFSVRNRITWEREKGRGAKTNWKNSSEDIWFCTMSDEYTFNVDMVKMKRKVIAPYKENGKPKDWEETSEGNYRLTHPSNFWNDITIPFWSMPENTDHPTQKSEKLIAKLILASSNVGDVVLDPFLGSGTSAVVAKKLCRRFIGIEINEDYCYFAAKRLTQANPSGEIQGYFQGVFWERNTLQEQMKTENKPERTVSKKKQMVNSMQSSLLSPFTDE